jgi:hypothetical protein
VFSLALHRIDLTARYLAEGASRVARILSLRAIATYDRD